MYANIKPLEILCFFNIRDVFRASPQQHKEHFMRTQRYSVGEKKNRNVLQSEKCNEIIRSIMHFFAVRPTQWHGEIGKFRTVFKIHKSGPT